MLSSSLLRSNNIYLHKDFLWKTHPIVTRIFQKKTYQKNAPDASDINSKNRSSLFFKFPFRTGLKFIQFFLMGLGLLSLVLMLQTLTLFKNIYFHR